MSWGYVGLIGGVLVITFAVISWLKSPTHTDKGNSIKHNSQTKE